MIYTTLNKILAHGPCGRDSGSTDGWTKLLRYLNKTLTDDEPLSIMTILESNGIDDALWALRAVDGYEREMRELACDFAEHVLPLYEAIYPGDSRPRHCIEVARKFARGEATKSEMDAAGDAAWDTVWNVARDPAWDAVWDTSWGAEREWQRAHLIEWLHTMGEIMKQ